MLDELEREIVEYERLPISSVIEKKSGYEEGVSRAEERDIGEVQKGPSN